MLALSREYISPIMRKPTMWFLNMFDTNRAVYGQNMAGGGKF